MSIFKKISLKSKYWTLIGVVLAYLVIKLLVLTNIISPVIKSLLVPICCYVVVALALNLCVGFSGELSLGHAGFMAIGAFSAICISGLLERNIGSVALRILISLICAGIISCIFGLIISIPVLKLQGDYLAIVTLAFCVIIQSVINCMYLGFDNNGLQFSFIDNKLKIAKGGKILLSGPMGATGTSRIATFEAGIILLLVTLIVIYNLMESKYGCNIKAARDNKIASQCAGVNVLKTKTMVFALSALLAGMAGGLFGLNYSSLTPAKFDYNTSILILVYVVLGGLGNINGTIISTIVLVMLPELLRSINDYRMLVYALLLIVIMLITNNEHIKQIISNIKEKVGRKKWLEKY